MFRTLAEYEIAIDAAAANIADLVERRNRLRELSQAIRRQLWNNRAAAKELALKADTAAYHLERQHPELGATGPWPRFEAVYQGGRWSPAIP